MLKGTSPWHGMVALKNSDPFPHLRAFEDLLGKRNISCLSTFALRTGKSNSCNFCKPSVCTLPEILEVLPGLSLPRPSVMWPWHAPPFRGEHPKIKQPTCLVFAGQGLFFFSNLGALPTILGPLPQLVFSMWFLFLGLWHMLKKTCRTTVTWDWTCHLEKYATKLIWRTWHKNYASGVVWTVVLVL